MTGSSHRISWLALFIAAVAVAPARAQATARMSDPPRIVLDGLNTYRVQDSRAALSIWLKDSPANNTETIERMVATFVPVEVAYGHVVGHEIIRVVDVGQSVRRVYVVIRHDRGPLFAYFDCYRTSEGWIISSLLFNTQAAEVLPRSLLTGDR
jgi:hypothetical protein